MFDSLRYSPANPRMRKRFLLSGYGRGNVAQIQSDHLRELQWQALRSLHYGNYALDHQQLILGFDEFRDTPTFLNRNGMNSHVFFGAGTGAGKTTLVTNYNGQLILQARLALTLGQTPHSMVMLDLKPDLIMLKILKHFCEAQPYPGLYLKPLPFKWALIGNHTEPTMVMNPFGQRSFYDRLLPFQQGSFHAMAANLKQNPVYGESWFAACLHEICCLMPVLKPNINSFRDLLPFRRMSNKELAASLRIDESDAPAMKHFIYIISQMARPPMLQPSFKQPYGVSKEVLDSQIDIGEVFKESQFVYFALDGKLEEENARMAASYVLSSLDFAATYMPGPTLQVYCSVDEADNLAKLRNVKSWLTKIRSSGVSLFLIAQSLAQFEEDTRQLVLNSTGVKIILEAKDEPTQQAIELYCGTKKVWKHSESVSFTTDEWGQDVVESGFSRTETEELTIEKNDMERLTHKQQLGVLIVHPEIEKSYSGIPGRAHFFRRTHCVSKAEWEAFDQMEIPHAPGTFVPAEHPDLIRDPTFEDAPIVVTSNGNGKSNGKSKRNKRQTTPPDIDAVKLLEERLGLNSDD